MSQLRAAIAATRFSMGAREGEITDAASDPRGWLEKQVKSGLADMPSDGLQSAAQGVRAVMVYEQEARRVRDGEASEADTSKVMRSIAKHRRDYLQKEIVARNEHAVTTPHGFAERWARFWANHFTVAVRNPQMIALAGAFEREAIRPNVFGSFKDLLHASTFHQGMLVYLDNFRSFGPSSRPAKRRGLGLNENLAREVLELHTIGVDGGYTQDDVISFAKALTGWTVGRPPMRRGDDIGETAFIGRIHEPGRKTVLGKEYRKDGREQAKDILDDLARHPSTARVLATKLAVHFISDTPPQGAIDTLEAEFKRSDGDLTQLAKSLINLDAAWDAEPTKFKTPEELLISTARLMGMRSVFGGRVRAVYRSFGQVPFLAPSPQGWPDSAEDWAGPDAIMKRMEWANRTARRAPGSMNSERFLDEALGPLATPDTRLAVSRAESQNQGLTLALMSPEFQRR